MRSEYKNIHFIGIDGAGMTPLALHCAKTGYTVTGSDLKDDNFSQLKKAGVSVKKGHSEIPDNTDLVVYSAAVKEDNAELTDAAKKNIECVKRAKFLAKITKDHTSVLVSGSHGKSTTSVMLADMANGLYPFYASAIIGAESVSMNSNYYAGKGDHVIVEADEYDKSFLQLDPDDLVILNIDNDHLDIYHTTERLKAAFCELAAKLKKDSLLVYNLDDMHSVSVAETAKCRHAGFGIKNRSGYYALDIEYRNMRTSFDLYRSGKYLSKIEYVYTGRHNVYNMLACLTLLAEKGTDPEKLPALAENFRGIKRRMEVIYSDKEYTLIDDYAHHPTEVKEILKSVRQMANKRVIALFQPHLFSRTKDQAKEFAKSFTDADVVLISHIYPAREKPDNTVTSGIIKDNMTAEESQKTKVFQGFGELSEHLNRTVRKGDLIISLGAGEINKVLYEFKKGLI